MSTTQEIVMVEPKPFEKRNDDALYKQLKSRMDFAAIRARDHDVLRDWFDADPHRTIKGLAQAIGYDRTYVQSVVTGDRPLAESFAQRVNERLDLGLWGVPRARGPRS